MSPFVGLSSTSYEIIEQMQRLRHAFEFTLFNSGLLVIARLLLRKQLPAVAVRVALLWGTFIRVRGIGWLGVGAAA